MKMFGTIRIVYLFSVVVLLFYCTFFILLYCFRIIVHINSFF